MKQLILLAILCAIFTINSRATEAKSTGDSLYVAGINYPILQDDSGERFVQCYKTNGKPYRAKVWHKTGDKFNGHDIYRYKRKSYFYYGISRHGYPMYVWLIKNK
jgi:hypothetical protein